MTRNLLKRLALAVTIALIPAVGFAENTVPFPDPTQACRTQIQGGTIPEIYNMCIADNQRGYDIVKQLWPELSQESAERCDRAYGHHHYTGAKSDAHDAVAWSVMSECVIQLHAAQPLPRPRLSTSGDGLRLVADRPERQRPKACTSVRSTTIISCVLAQNVAVAMREGKVLFINRRPIVTYPI